MQAILIIKMLLVQVILIKTVKNNCLFNEQNFGLDNPLFS